MDHEVVLRESGSRPTAVVAAETSWRDFHRVWPGLSGEVWECLRAGGITRGCPNVILYRDLAADVAVEVGVILEQPCALTGRVQSSSLPAGTVAMTVHRGDYGGLASAHRAVAQWCSTRGYVTTGTRWEIYGPHSDDPAQVTTEVYWLLEP